MAAQTEEQDKNKCIHSYLDMEETNFDNFWLYDDV